MQERIGNRMLLAADIGNTSTTFGVFKGRKLVRAWRASTGDILSGKPVKLPGGVGRAIISSVVPKATPAVGRAISRKYGIIPLILGKNIKAPIKNLYIKPGQVGQDRLVNAVAVKELYGYPAIVVDFGTAITFDVISKKGEYLGGLIFPGIETSLNALSEKAALLPSITVVPPKGLIGRETADSMRSGVFHGIGALCDGIISLLEKKLGPMTVIATGGHAKVVSGFSRSIRHIDPHLTLKGLRIIAEK
ncbi:MAG: type III pantothenate kinase [Candidatus Omnitrophica bacterium]|nr:type III pantothenate kinase [Candidatus Omnitrophota bacterium]